MSRQKIILYFGLLVTPFFVVHAGITCYDEVEKYAAGFVTIEMQCKENDSNCFGIGYVIRNRCQGENLVQHRCNKQMPDHYSFNLVPCKNGCQEINHVGRCNK